MRVFWLACMFFGLCCMTACNGCPTTPNKNPSTSPNLTVNVWDYNCTTSPPCPSHPNDITGLRTYPPAAGNPFQYGGLLDLRSETSFDATVLVRARDPVGLQELNITCLFNCAGDQGWEPLKSFNNTAKQPDTNRFTLTSRALLGQPTTDLVFPITLTTADLKTVTCGNSQPSSGNGTILVLATAKNFSTNPATQITQGYWEILVGADSAVVVPPDVSH